MDVDAQAVTQKLAMRVAQLEMEVAVLQCALERYEKQTFEGQDAEE